MTDGRRVVYVIGFGAPPVLHLHEFLQLLDERGWDPYVSLSPTAASWVDVDNLAKISGHPVRVESRGPHESDPLPSADAIVAAPLTFNALNKWAAGISDTLAGGILNEALGLGIPVTAALCIKDPLRRHPGYSESVQRLRDAGVTLMDGASITVRSDTGSLNINWALVTPSRSRSMPAE